MRLIGPSRSDNAQTIIQPDPFSIAETDGLVFASITVFFAVIVLVERNSLQFSRRDTQFMFFSLSHFQTPRKRN